MVSSIRTAMLIRGKIERTENNLMHFNPLPPSDAVRETEKNILRDLFRSLLSQYKKISPLWKPEIELFRHFSKLKIAYFNRKIPFNFSNAKFYYKFFGLLRIK